VEKFPSQKKIQVTVLKCDVVVADKSRAGLEPNDAVPIRMQIRNTGSDKTPLKFALYVEDDDFFIEHLDYAKAPIPNGQDGDFFDFVLPVYRTVQNLELMPQFKTLCIISTDVDSQDRVVVYKTFDLTVPIKPYIDCLLSKPDPLSILVFGPMGTGKSGFVNSCYTLLQDSKDVIKFTPSLPKDTSVTLKISHFVPGRQAEGTARIIPAAANVKITDTWGMERSGGQYPSWFWAPLFEGKVPDGTESKDITDQQTPEAKNWKPVNPINVAIIAMTVQAIREPAYMNLIVKHVLPKMTQRGLAPLVMLTQVDTIDEALAKDLYDRKEKTSQGNTCFEMLTELRERVSAALTIPVNQIVGMVNYQGKSREPWGTDRAVYVLLRQAFMQKKQLPTPKI